MASSLTGCIAHAFHVSQQPARVKVTMVDSGEPASNAQVVFGQRDYRLRTQIGGSERDELWFPSGMNDPATTNEEGLAMLSVNIGLYRGLFSEPFDPYRDRLSGQTYMFRIQREDAIEILHVAMVPGHVSCGQIFKVAILSIGPSKDVTQEYHMKERR